VARKTTTQSIYQHSCDIFAGCYLLTVSILGLLFSRDHPSQPLLHINWLFPNSLSLFSHSLASIAEKETFSFCDIEL